MVDLIAHTGLSRHILSLDAVLFPSVCRVTSSFAFGIVSKLQHRGIGCLLTACAIFAVGKMAA